MKSDKIANSRTKWKLERNIWMIGYLFIEAIEEETTKQIQNCTKYKHRGESWTVKHLVFFMQRVFVLKLFVFKLKPNKNFKKHWTTSWSLYLAAVFPLAFHSAQIVNISCKLAVCLTLEQRIGKSWKLKFSSFITVLSFIPK